MALNIYRRHGSHCTVPGVHSQGAASRHAGRPATVRDSLSGLAPASQKRILASVKSPLTFCLKIGYSPFNVGAALTVRKPKNTIAERILPHEDVARDSRNHAMLRFLYESGCRVSELCGITWRDVQPRDGGLAQVTVFGKGDKTRHVLISKRLYRELARLRGAVPEDAPHARIN